MMDRLRVGLGWLFMAISAIGLPLAAFKPNRVLKGVEIYFYQAFGQMGVGVVVVFLLTLGILLFLGRGKPTAFAKAVPMLLTVIPAGLLTLTHQIVLPQVITEPTTLRISLGSGFWLFCAGLIILQSGFKGFGWTTTATIAFSILVIVLGLTPNLSLYKEALVVKQQLVTEFGRHLTLAFTSVLVAFVPGIAMGYGSYKNPKIEGAIIATVNLFQVIPTLSLLGLLMIPLTLLSQAIPFLATFGIKGIGFAPAFIVLSLYCLLPITVNALAGFKQVERDVIDSALAMGMNNHQLFWRVLLPLASPIIVSGLRTAVTQNIGNTILAGLIGGGGMGALIFLGLSQSASDLVILATLPVVLLALSTDKAFQWLEHRLIVKVGTRHDTAEQHL